MFETATEYMFDSDLHMLLADLPTDLIKENIRDQIENPLSTTVNFTETVIDKIRELENIYGDNDEVMRNVHNECISFFSFIIEQISERFELGIDSSYFTDFNQIKNIGLALYNFFILNYKENITNFFYYYIIKNKKAIVSQFESYLKKKDVTTNSTKKKIKNREDVLIVSNLPNVINYIANLEIEPVDFILYASNISDFEINSIISLIELDHMSGGFVYDYINLVIDDYDYILDEIMTDIKLRLVTKNK